MKESLGLLLRENSVSNLSVVLSGSGLKWRWEIYPKMEINFNLKQNSVSVRLGGERG